METVAAMPGFRLTAERPQARKRPEALIHIFIRIKLNTLPAFGWDEPLPMNHPPSKTVGRKYWLAKAIPITTRNAALFLCPPPAAQLRNGTYSFTPATFDPRGLTLAEATKEGLKTSIFKSKHPRFGGQIWRMANEVNVGDVIFLEGNNHDLFAWGEVIRPYAFKAKKQKLTHKDLESEGLHSVGVRWHEIKNGQGAFSTGRWDNLLFREISHRTELVQTLVALTKGLPTVSTRQGGEDAPQDLEYREGGKVLQTHLRTERDAKAAKLAKELARERAKPEDVSCETCKCIPKKSYKGMDLIEAHHRIPLARGVRETKPEHFAMLCPCCHRAVHKLINDGVEPIAALKRLSKLFA